MESKPFFFRFPNKCNTGLYVGFNLVYFLVKSQTWIKILEYCHWILKINSRYNHTSIIVISELYVDEQLNVWDFFSENTCGQVDHY